MPNRKARSISRHTPRRSARTTAPDLKPQPGTKRKEQTANRKSEIARPYVPTPAPRKTLYILSDSTGNLARHMLTAFLTQFPPDAFDVRLKTFLENEQRLRAAFDEIAAHPGIILHALVSDDAKQTVRDFCRAHDLPSCDLTGEFVDFLARESGIQPTQDHTRLHHVDEVYQRRIRAIEFALEHDDGLGLDTIHEADLVLVGVSRTSKTPTTIYLAQHGYYVGNVSLAYGIEAPAQLLALPRQKVVGLTIDPTQLVEIRTRRQREWGMAQTQYNDPYAVDREIEWTRRLFARQGWPTINVTNQAIEETAARILDITGLIRARGL